MKVLVDCTQITTNKAGVGVYALNLVRGLCELPDRSFELYLLAQDDDADFHILGKNIHTITIKSRFFRFIPLRVLMEQVYIPLLVRKFKIDVVHSLHYSFPLFPIRAKKVVTIHDMTSFLMPEVHLGSKVLYFRSFINAGSRFANDLIFVSKSTLNDWKERFPKSECTTYTIPLGISEEFRASIDESGAAAVREKFSLDGPYVLYIGTIEPRKNLTRLVKAFASVSAEFPSYRLIVAGMKGWGYQELLETIRDLQLESRVLFTGFVTEEDKIRLLMGAEIFTYPSLYEGFGIPVLEAMACGIPTLTSATSSLREIAGEGALLADPLNVQDIEEKLRQLLREPGLRKALKDRALRQASNFNWKRTVNETVNVYRSHFR